MTHPHFPELRSQAEYEKTTPPSQVGPALVVLSAVLGGLFLGWLAYEGMTWLIYWSVQ